MLSSSVLNIKGVGEKLHQDLQLMNIQTIEDLLFHFPYRYEIYEAKPLSELRHDEKVTIVGRVMQQPSLSFFGKNNSRLAFTLEVENVTINAVMFNRAFAKNHIKPGDMITVTGKWDAQRLQITIDIYKVGKPKKETKIQSLYSVKGDLTNNRFRNIIKMTLQQYTDYIEEILPLNYLELYKIPKRHMAIQTMHFPTSNLALKHARRRFTYEEFLLFQLKIQLLRKLKREETIGNAQHYDPLKLQAFINSFPFTLTTAQNKSLNEILSDMKSPYRMNRLLQGDVGSGKTAVASIGLYASITAGKQGALMVPTEILAEQHFESLKENFSEEIKIVLLTGSIKGKKREKITSSIESGEADIVIGTHALIQDDVFFNDLGIVIVDEQHRFGVNQRRALRDKGFDPDVLFMTATPIPRTLAITAFGDMDVSVIDELPAGRKEIKTYWVKEQTLERVLYFVQKQVNAGEQAYVVCPLIEESDKLDIQDAVDLFRQLEEFYPSSISIGLMHGRLSSSEKDEVMKRFVQNKIQILVSTTVVEVGVNVPNATIMIVYNAERFGLSQLHQLRGRVGRGSKQSYCILIADPKGEIGQERMRIMTKTNDGFELAEQDLKLRGPGDFFGKKQSGLPEFKVADMVHDYRALETARQDAYEIIETNKLQTDAVYRKLKQYIENDPFFSEKLD